MAKIEYIDPIASISGRLSKKDKTSTIQRRKHYRDEQGRVIAEGRNESYCRAPRDYKKHPPRGEELRNITLFQQAARLHPIRPPTHPQTAAGADISWHNYNIRIIISSLIING